MCARLQTLAVLVVAVLLCVIPRVGNGQTLLPFELTNGTGDGTLSVGVDGFGSFGSAVGGATSNAFYDPVGDVAAAGTTFQSGLFISGPPAWLSSGTFDFGDVVAQNFPNPEVTGNSTSGSSTFTHGALSFALEQDLIDSLDEAGNRVGTVLSQRYAITNTVDVPNNFTLTRYLDGDLNFDGTNTDGGGALLRDGNLIVFETDAAESGGAASTFVGITSSVGLTTGGTTRFAVSPFDTLLTQISQGGGLASTIENDPDLDGIIDAAFDVTIAISNAISIAANQTVVYTTQTLFGSSDPPVPGSLEVLPLLPATDDQPFVFNVVVEDPEERIWFDPEVTFGYAYEVDGVNVTSLTLPSELTVAQIGQYQLELFNGTDFDLAALVEPGETFDFGALGVDRFRITNIDTGLALDPNDPLAFPVGLTFASSGPVQLTITPLSVAIPEPGSATLIVSLLLLAGSRRRRSS